MQDASHQATVSSLLHTAQALPRRKWALGGLIATASAAVVLGIGALAGSPAAWARGIDGAQAMHAAWGGPGHGLQGGLFFGGPRQIDRLLDRIDATPAQREQIKPIAEKAAADLKALHEEGRKLHEDGLKLWAQPTLDARAAEQLRQRMEAHHDKVSKRVLQATLDVGNVLTPDQRTRIAEHMKKRHERMREHFRHHPGDPAQGASAPTKS